jgi:hypothetical protein
VLVLGESGADIRLSRLSSVNTDALTRLASHAADLKYVQACCKQLQELCESAQGQGPYYTAISHSAVVTYARCFATGVRDSLRAVLEKAPTNLLAQHDYFVDLRNKHVAHSVSELEQTHAVVAWKKQRGRYRPSSVGAVHVSMSGLSQHDYTRLSALANWLLGELNAPFQAEREQLFKAVTAVDERELRAGVPLWQETEFLSSGLASPKRQRRR